MPATGTARPALEVALTEYFHVTTADARDRGVLAQVSRPAAAIAVRALEYRALLEPDLALTTLERRLLAYFDFTEASLDRTLVKGCRCGNGYTAEEWAARPLRYTRDDDDGPVAARDCRCGSTLEAVVGARPPRPR